MRWTTWMLAMALATGCGGGDDDGTDGVDDTDDTDDTDTTDGTDTDGADDTDDTDDSDGADTDDSAAVDTDLVVDVAAGLWHHAPFDGASPADVSPSGWAVNTGLSTLTWVDGRDGAAESALANGGCARYDDTLFDGSADQLTVSFWVEPDNAWVNLDRRTVVDHDLGAFEVFHEDGRWSIAVLDEDEEIWQLDMPVSAEPRDVWVHVVFTVDATTGTVRGWRNGNEETLTGDPPPSLYGGTHTLRIGCTLGADVDEHRIYDRAVNPLEAAALYQIP